MCCNVEQATKGKLQALTNLCYLEQLRKKKRAVMAAIYIMLTWERAEIKHQNTSVVYP